MSTNGQKRKIVLFHPHYFEGKYNTCQRQPLSLLAISAVLELKGYEIVIIDASVTEDYEQRIFEECEDALCFGTTSVLGYQVFHCNRIEKAVRERFPSLPIVAGGWFPTVMSEMVLNGGGANIVNIRQGETTFPQLVEALSSGESLEKINGLAFKNGENGDIVRTPPRAIEDINNTPPMPYHLIDLERYFASDPYERAKRYIYIARGHDLTNTKIRAIDYFSSYGCPDSCTFCSSPTVTGRRWTALKAERIVDELDHLVKKHRINVLTFIDANWGVDQKRVFQFSEGLLKKKIKLYWAASIEAHVMNKFDEKVIDTMAESGCVGLLIGAEAAYPETIKSIQKNIRPGDVAECSGRCTKRGIIPEISYIVGYPGEIEESVQSTIHEACELVYRHPTVEIGLRFFMPIPGTPLHARAVSMGYNEVKSIKDWRGFQNFQSEFYSNINPGQVKTIRRCQKYYFWWTSERLKDSKKLNVFEKILHRTSRFRLKHKLLGFPIEYKVYNLLNRFFTSSN